MTATRVKGLAVLQDRLAGSVDEGAVRDVLRREAEALAAQARAEAPRGLAETVEVRDDSRGGGIAYAVGTPHPAGHALEFGTLRRRAAPWLLPIFWARRNVVNDVLRNAVQAGFRRSGRAF